MEGCYFTLEVLKVCNEPELIVELLMAELPDPETTGMKTYQDIICMFLMFIRIKGHPPRFLPPKGYMQCAGVVPQYSSEL